MTGNIKFVRLSKIVFLTTILLGRPTEQGKAQGDWEPELRLNVGEESFQIQGMVIAQSRDGQTDTIFSFTKPSLETLLRYRPNVTSYFGYDSSRYQLADLVSLNETWIGAATASPDTIWVGFAYYEGEGSESVGGIGFYDIKTHTAGVLRHPCVVDWSIQEMLVTQDTIYLKTFGMYEGGSTYGNGLVAINRRTLQASARVPPGSEILSDKDDPSAENNLYTSRISELILDKTFLPKTVSQFSNSDSTVIQELGPLNFMIRTAEREKESK